MKKLLVASSVAAAAFLATGVASHNADAAELNTTEQTKLAETALNNPAELNQHPVQAGAYDFNFEYKGYEFHFESNGTYWEWSYAASGTVQQPTQVTSQAVSVQQQAAPVTKQTYSYNTSNQSFNNHSNYNYKTPSYYNSYASSVRLKNGNSAGAIGAYAAREMERHTGVHHSVWENIIARESNGQVNAYNNSGARGLFQTMPGHGSTATVQDQINSALHAYNVQGLSAWNY